MSSSVLVTTLLTGVTAPTNFTSSRPMGWWWPQQTRESKRKRVKTTFHKRWPICRRGRSLGSAQSCWTRLLSTPTLHIQKRNPLKIAKPSFILWVKTDWSKSVKGILNSQTFWGGGASSETHTGNATKSPRLSVRTNRKDLQLATSNQLWPKSSLKISILMRLKLFWRFSMILATTATILENRLRKISLRVWIHLTLLFSRTNLWPASCPRSTTWSMIQTLSVWWPSTCGELWSSTSNSSSISSTLTNLRSVVNSSWSKICFFNSKSKRFKS